MREESRCLQAKALRFAPAGTCKALAGPSRENRALQAVKSYKLSRKSPDSAQAVLGFVGSWGWTPGFTDKGWRGDTEQSGERSPGRPRTKLSPPRPAPLPESRGHAGGEAPAGRPGSARTAASQGPHSPERQEPLAHQPQRDPQQAQSHQPPHGAGRRCARAWPGSTVGGAHVRLQGAGHAPPRPWPRRVLDSGPWRLRPRPPPGLCQPKASLP